MTQCLDEFYGNVQHFETQSFALFSSFFFVIFHQRKKQKKPKQSASPPPESFAMYFTLRGMEGEAEENGEGTIMGSVRSGLLLNSCTSF